LPPGLPERVTARLGRLPIWAQGCATGLGAASIEALSPAGVAPFIYFQF
jgi:hypothetical protein